jgi:DNA-directed RNA polymerase II subunit RPB2
MMQSLDSVPKMNATQVDTAKLMAEYDGKKDAQVNIDFLLNHLDEYNQTPFDVLGTYFEGNPLYRLTRHQIESYNHFVTYQMQRTIDMFNPIQIKSDNDFNEVTNEYGLVVNIRLINLKFSPPQIYENNGATKVMMPHDARLRNFTYAANTTVDLNIEYVIRDSNNEIKTVEKTIPKIKICNLPVMLKSSICILKQYANADATQTGECEMDCGGYFIIKGSEKTVLCQERAAENRIYVFNGKNTPKWDWVAEFKSVPDSKCISPKQVEMMISSKKNLYGHGIYVVIPRVKQKKYIELFTLFRALGVVSDKRICEYILLNVEDDKQKAVLNFLQASIEDGKVALCDNDELNVQSMEEELASMNVGDVDYDVRQRELKEAIQDEERAFPFLQNKSMVDKKHIRKAMELLISDIAYNTYNIDRKQQGNENRKRDFTSELIKNEFFPHCRTLPQKLYLLGMMANKLIRTALGWEEPNDRDSYLNKRIELTGSLLNNLFRNHYIRFVKDVEKQVIKEINQGSWKSTESYENIINMTNIYKIFKSTTIENGINRALSTGDFSVKQSNSSSKVGVAQVLNRLTYLGTLSHLRRVNTPLEKSGELIAPRKLHGTSWGFLCPVETPEGQSIGVVKNLSFMTHMTIPTHSQYLHEYVKPYLVAVDDVATPCELFDEVKVIINGCWVGISKTPRELYDDMKTKKYKGILNIYTSIVFDYQKLEIRICNDAGRMVRPVLRVSDNKVMLTNDIVAKIRAKEYNWMDLILHNDKGDSVIEYIDSEEQTFSMIAMKTKEHYLHNLHPDFRSNEELRIRYTHCEIHPCTLMGVLGSCVPFPDYNQAPRNTYQCAMAKQAIGISTTNYDKRMDKTSYTLNYPTRPLVDTRMMDFLQLNKIPSGCQIHVAIMSYTGYNQEDSVLINKSAIDRGLFLATICHTEKDEDKNVIRDEIIRCRPDPAKTKGIKHGNYNKLNNHGFIPENTQVENRDIIIAKVVPIKENRNDPTKVIKYEDQSRSFRTTEETYIDKNYSSRNGDGCNFAKTRVRTTRKPVIGDKFCIKETSLILTHLGWVAFKDIDKDLHKVATLVDGERLAYVHPIAKYEFDCVDEELYSMDSQQVKMVCTMNHKVYVQKRDQKQFQLIEAKDIVGKRVSYKKDAVNTTPDLPNVTIGTKVFETKPFLSLLGAFISDGYYDSGEKHTRICIAMKKQRKIDYLSQALDELGVHYLYSHSRIIIGNTYKELVSFFQKLSVGASNKYLPDFVWNLSQLQCRVLLEALIQGDGSVTNSGTHLYHTSSCRLAEDIQKLCLHAGWAANMKVYAGREAGHSSILKGRCITAQYDSITLSIVKSKCTPTVNHGHIKTQSRQHESTVTYTGKVGCIEVPDTHLFYYKDSKFAPPVWTGNSSRHGQKGTVGNILAETDMPFTKDGLRPDLILNPHAIPSRMTIAHLKETLLGKVLIELGMFGDGTSFGNLDVATIAEELQRKGFESYGNEVLYDGHTGRQIETSIFVGPVFYQRLKHMVNDKEHSRSIGPVVNLTRQPAEGRSRDGGFRIGEMERDVMIAHGMSKFCRERMYNVSDKYAVHVCKCCGMIATFNNGDKGIMRSKPGMTVHKCNTCDNVTDFAYVEVPYAYKLMSQELQTINVVPRLITE